MKPIGHSVPRGMALRRGLRVLLAAFLVVAGAVLSWSQEGKEAVLLRLKGAVSPATADYISRGLREAVERGASIVILQMDTPGGLDTSMRGIIHDILASPVPVAGYVAPSGARAASAGTYIMYASHVAAMAPGTNLGAATPIQIGGGGGLPFGGGEQDQGQDEDKGAREGEAKPAAPKNAGEAKAINDAVAYIRGLAELRGRNMEWAEKAVREAASMTATRAAEENVVDFTATSVEDLLEKVNGMTVQVGQAERTLQTAGLTVTAIEPDWRNRLLSILTDPNMALIFMMIGIYGLIFEFMNPGALVPGTIGAISLIIGLYSLAVLPVSYAGVALILLGVALIVAEAFAPSFGIMGVGGAAALVLGAMILFDTDVPGLEVSWPVIGGVGVASLAFAMLVASLALTSRRRTVVSGREEMVGATGEVMNWSGRAGHVFVHGERWRATGDRAFRKGETVRVTGMDGLTLTVAGAAD